MDEQNDWEGEPQDDYPDCDPGPSDADLAQADREAEQDAKAQWEAEMSAQGEAEAQAHDEDEQAKAENSYFEDSVERIDLKDPDKIDETPQIIEVPSESHAGEHFQTFYKGKDISGLITHVRISFLSKDLMNLCDHHKNHQIEMEGFEELKADLNKPPTKYSEDCQP